MKRAWLIMYQIFIIALSLVTAIFIFLYMDTLTDKILYFVFLLLSLFIIPFLHECGHLIFGLMAGMKLHEINIFNLKIIFLKNTIAVKRVKWNEQQDSCTMYPIKTDHLQMRFLWMSAGGLIVNFLFIILALIAIYFSHQPLVTCIFGASLPFACYLFLFNLYPFENENGYSDGYYIISALTKEDKSKVLLNCLCIQGKLAQGNRPIEIEEELFEKVPQIAEDEKEFSMIEWLRYLRALDGGEREKAKEYLSRLEQLQEDYGNMDDAILAEIGYGYCVYLLDAKKSEEYIKKSKIELQKTATSYRIQASYAVYFDKNSESLIEKGLKALTQEDFSGIARMEEKLLQSLKNRK